MALQKHPEKKWTLMITALFLLCHSLLALSAAEVSLANLEKAKGDSESEQSRESVTPEPELNELERAFQNMLSGASFVGRWCVVEDGNLKEEREERYDLKSVRKVNNDTWAIYARIQYGQRDVVVPVPVQVKWAGDTPVISVTDFGIPGMGTYTARVVVYDNMYAGTWSAPGHSGLLHGIITKPKPESDVK